MGSFNVAANISGLSLNSGEEVLLFPLIPSNFDFENVNLINKVNLHRSSNLISNNSSQILYNIFCLPISGIYDDYGNISSIEENENTRYIEKYFGISIEEFTQAITEESYIDCIDEDKNNILKSLSGMWESKLFYTNVTQNFNIHNTAYDNSDLSVHNLEFLGFKKENKDTEDERYHLYYTHPDIPNLIGHSDGTWTHFFYNGNSLSNTFNIKQLVKELSSEGINSNLLHNLDKFKNSTHLFLQLERIIKSINESKKPNDDNEKIREILIQCGESEENIKKTLEVFSKNPLFNPFEKTLIEYYPNFQYAVTNELKYDLDNLMSFLSIVNSTNKILMPTQNGEQFGNDKVHKILTQETMKILNYRLGFGNF